MMRRTTITAATTTTTHNAMYRFAWRIRGIATIVIIYLIVAAAQLVYGDDSDSQSCAMEMEFYSSFDTCYDRSIATATIYADGQCHTVETDVSTSDPNYSLLPGNYRVECDSDGTLVFLDSGCLEGTCSPDGSSCPSDTSMAGSLFARVTGQLVQDRDVGEFYDCETLYDDVNEIFVVVFGDCSRPGCSVNGSINNNPTTPSEPSTPTTTTPPVPVAAPQPEPPTAQPISSPQLQPQPTPSETSDLPTSTPEKVPTRRPVTTTNSPQSEPSSPTVEPVRLPTPETAPAPAPISSSLAPIVPVFNPPTLAPISASGPIATTAPVGLSPVQTTSPVVVDTPTALSPTILPTISPSMAATKSATPSATPRDATLSPNTGVRSPTVVDRPTVPTLTDSVTTQSSSSIGTSFIVLGAIGGSITIIVLILIFVLARKQCRPSTSVTSKNGAVASTTSSDKSKTLLLGGAGGGAGSELNNHERLMTPAATNEIWFDPTRDDVSTLDGGTLPDMALNNGGDEPTASVNMDFDYNKNRFRSSNTTVDENSRFTSSTNPTAFTNLSKLGFRSATSSLFDRNTDEQSFDQQFADMDDEEIMTAVGSMNWSRTRSNATGNHSAAVVMNDIANRIRPFEVMVPPGMVGLVIDTPQKSVPVIRAIRPTSVLYPQVQVGDRLISVDQQNVTSMSAQEVSQLITDKQHEHRVFVFCRLVAVPAVQPEPERPPQQQSSLFSLQK